MRLERLGRTGQHLCVPDRLAHNEGQQGDGRNTEMTAVAAAVTVVLAPCTTALTTKSFP